MSTTGKLLISGICGIISVDTYNSIISCSSSTITNFVNAGRKTTLIIRICDRDIVFVTVFQKPLSDINDIFITRLLLSCFY
jgi:hypothetical protein